MTQGRPAPGTRRLVFVAGAARSGTTLLGEMLGAQPRVLNLGEFALFWRDADRGNACACGEAIPTCPLWGAALQELARTTGVQQSDYAGLASTRARLSRTTRPFRLTRMIADPSGWSAAETRLVGATSALLDIALVLAAADVAVDTSKVLPALRFHRLTPDRRVDVVHLVRDPRAVAASTVRSRDVVRGNADSLPPGGSLGTAVYRWVWVNASLAPTTWRGRGVRLRYEPLVERPESELSRLCAALGVTFDPTTVSGHSLRPPRASHAAVGNPRRGAAVTPLAKDERWRTELTPARRRLVRALTWPLDASLGRPR